MEKTKTRVTTISGFNLKPRKQQMRIYAKCIIRIYLHGAWFTQTGELSRGTNGTHGVPKMKKIEIEISENLFDRITEIGKKFGMPEVSMEIRVLDLLIDGVIENEKILKMVEDK